MANYVYVCVNCHFLSYVMFIKCKGPQYMCPTKKIQLFWKQKIFRTLFYGLTFPQIISDHLVNINEWIFRLSGCTYMLVFYFSVYLYVYLSLCILVLMNYVHYMIQFVYCFVHYNIHECRLKAENINFVKQLQQQI